MCQNQQNDSVIKTTYLVVELKPWNYLLKSNFTNKKYLIMPFVSGNHYKTYKKKKKPWKHSYCTLCTYAFSFYFDSWAKFGLFLFGHRWALKLSLKLSAVSATKRLPICLRGDHTGENCFLCTRHFYFFFIVSCFQISGKKTSTQNYTNRCLFYFTFLKINTNQFICN